MQATQESSTSTIRSLTCYDKDVTVKIDPNNHRRREIRDASGHLITVQEYKGTYSSCSTEEGSPYATTTYQYDVLGNLRYVTDAKGNQGIANHQTEMRYDTLGRKLYMSDPDMGVWTYTYDTNGSLETQTDAKEQIVTFAYDELNRLKTKSNGTSLVLTNYYDESSSSNSIGRLSRMVDTTGQTAYNYDSMGRVTSSTKTIDGTAYNLGFNFLNGRLDSITYPDNEKVNYTYDTGYLKGVTGYIAYSNFDALGRPWNAAYGTGGASSSYTYYPDTRRLHTLSVVSPNQGLLIDNSYGYDNKGNITSITDNLGTVRPTNFSSETYIPDASRAHAVGATVSGNFFQYDSNGNMIRDNQRGITYNYDNMPTAVNNVSFAYDGNSTRVKKSSPGSTTVYISKLFECTNGTCKKFIFAGDTRIATKIGTQISFYHPDHLGSTSVVTDAAGNKANDIAYFPFGGTRQESNPTLDSYKYTGQEQDGTGLYNYNARLYDPDLGRFITPDSIVPDPADPQSFNRYAYARNNPMLYTDPTGHWFGLDDLVAAVVGAIVGGVSAAIEGHNVWEGMGVGAAAGWVGWNTFGTASAAVENMTGSSFAGGAVGGAAGGAAAGATSSAMTGTNIGEGASNGAFGGAIIGAASSFGTANFSPFGNSAAGSIGNRVFNSGLTGAVFGAGYSAAAGGNIGQGAMWGAASWAGGEAANMAIGHAYGFIASGGNGPTFSNGAFVYNANTDGWITLGNVITGPNGLGNELTRDGIPVPGMTFLDHEMGHMPQSTLLGPAYIPAQAASLTVGAAIGLVSGQGAIYGSHAYGLLERYYHPVPQW